MGTRHYQCVISREGITKIRQYGQWDGYPGGQGVEIIEYLKNGNLDKYQDNLSKIPLITEEQIDEINKLKDWPRKYPYLSRDCGSNIHKMIENGIVEFVQHTDEEEANKWCEGFYTIDFSKNTFTTEYRGINKSYSLIDLPSVEQYLHDTKNK